jgi:hypothetical protein
MTHRLNLFGRCVEAFGIDDGKNQGRISFNKTVTMVALGVWGWAIGYIIVALLQIPPWYIWSFGIVVIGAGFGLKGYSVAMANRKEEFSAASQHTVQSDVAAVIAAVKDRRDTPHGVDPA